MKKNVCDHLDGGLTAPAQTSKYTEDDQQGARRGCMTVQRDNGQRKTQGITAGTNLT